MSVRKFVDTNVLVYAFDDAEPEKQAVAWELLERAPTEHQLVLSTQVLQEFYVVTTRKLERPLDEQAAEAAVRALSRLPVVQVDSELFLAGITLSREHRLSLWDALIVRAAQRGACAELLTEDLDPHTRFDQVTIVDPFQS